jgi:hypothetical protein
LRPFLGKFNTSAVSANGDSAEFGSQINVNLVDVKFSVSIAIAHSTRPSCILAEYSINLKRVEP